MLLYIELLSFLLLLRPSNICHKLRPELFQVQSQFGKYIENGNLELISPPAEFYPDFTTLRLTLGDDLERVQWRSKQVMRDSF